MYRNMHDSDDDIRHDQLKDLRSFKSISDLEKEDIPEEDDDKTTECESELHHHITTNEKTKSFFVNDMDYNRRTLDVRTN